MAREQDKGSPPPRISSSEDIPVEVIMVEVENGERRVPWGRFARPEGILRLKDDIARSSGTGV